MKLVKDYWYVIAFFKHNVIYGKFAENGQLN